MKSLFSINLIHKEVINIAQDGRTLNSGSKIAEISKTCFCNIDDNISCKNHPSDLMEEPLLKKTEVRLSYKKNNKIDNTP